MGRIFLHPGFVTSKTDGQIHFIHSQTLAKLYKVNFQECIIIPYNSPEKGRKIAPLEGDLHLYPDYTGKYSIKEDQ